MGFLASMTRDEFHLILASEQLLSCEICFDQVYSDDKMVIRFDEHKRKWTQYYCERGGFHGQKFFDSESDALSNILKDFRQMKSRKASWEKQQ